MMEELTQACRIGNCSRYDGHFLPAVKCCLAMLGLGVDWLDGNAALRSQATIFSARFTLDCGHALVHAAFWDRLMNQWRGFVSVHACRQQPQKWARMALHRAVRDESGAIREDGAIDHKTDFLEDQKL